MPLAVRRAGADEYGNTIKVLLCGDAGAGKTRLSSTFPHVFYANLEGGLMSVADRHVPYVDIRSSAELQELLIGLRQSPKIREQFLKAPVETIVIDTLDTLQKLLMEERKSELRKDTLAIADWGWLGDQMRLIVRQYRNLPLNVIFTCHVKTDQDADTGQTFVKPALQGAMGDEIAAYVDLAVLLRAQPFTKVVDGKNERVLRRVMQTSPDARHSWLKDRSGKLPFEVEVDLTTDYGRLRKLIFSDALPASSDLGEAVLTEPDLPPAQAVRKQAAGKGKEETKAEPPPAPTPPPTEAQEVPAANGSTKTEPEVVEVKPEPEAVESATESTENVSEPQPEAKPEANGSSSSAEAPQQELTDQAASPEVVCENCGVEITADEADISWLRYRKRMCRKDFIAAKSSAKAAK